MKVISDLFSIHSFREERAERNVARSELAHSDAVRARDAAIARLQRYRRHADIQQRKWYARLCSEVVGLGSIEKVQQDVAVLRAGERHKEVAMDQAARTVADAHGHLEAARTMLLKASQKKRKLAELTAQLAAEGFQDALRAEELELEEAAALLYMSNSGRRSVRG